LEERERELAINAQPEIALLETEADILTRRLQEAKSQAAKAKKGEERERLTGEAAELAQQLVSLSVPVSARLIADDATSEAIASLLAEQGGRIAVMSTEGGLVEEALTQLLPQAKAQLGDSPNARGTALYLLCEAYLEQQRRTL
jgi:hypothetical protein